PQASKYILFTDFCVMDSFEREVPKAEGFFAKMPATNENVWRTMSTTEALKLIEQAAAEEWTELDLSGMDLEELPPEIRKLDKLETLILYNEQVSSNRNGQPEVFMNS
ncbi:hypothetical protein, partial [[Limnothrix rosea] IAM M-220]|uniref:hypothetical protein n=1 Tax=[Limnothrix rosea] IAM M-220 TaxID=454133 RepID=UPI00095EEBA7